MSIDAVYGEDYCAACREEAAAIEQVEVDPRSFAAYLASEAADLLDFEDWLEIMHLKHGTDELAWSD